MAGANMKHINQRQAADAMALLREYVALLDGKSMSAQPTDFWTTRVEKLVLEVDQLRGRAAYQRWCIGRDGRGFRAGDWVYVGVRKLHVARIDPERQMFYSSPDSDVTAPDDGHEWHDAKTAIKVSPTAATTAELEEIGQYAMGFDQSLASPVRGARA